MCPFMILCDVCLLVPQSAVEIIPAQNFEIARKSRVGVLCVKLHGKAE